MDADGFIVASDLTESGVDDASVAVTMIQGLGPCIKRFTGDGAYDTRPVYEALTAVGGGGVTVVIPPRKKPSGCASPNAVLQQRKAAIARIAEVGRRQWRKESGAHKQARAENMMLRYKRIIGGGLRARKMAAQTRETVIAVSVLNRMTRMGTPRSVAVVG